jgi:hypothetical protein
MMKSAGSCHGQRIYISVNSEGKKVHPQKQLTLCNLKQTYLSFKEENHEKLPGFLSLQSCSQRTVLAGAHCMYAVCMFAIHQKVKQFYVQNCMILTESK